MTDNSPLLHTPLPWRFLVPALTVPLIGSLIYFVWLPAHPVAKAVYGGTKLFTLVYPLCFLGWRETLRGKPQQNWGRVIALGLLSGGVISLLGSLLMATPVGAMVWGGAGLVREKASALGFAQHYLLFALFISLFHSALEEFYWRGFVFGQLRNRLGAPISHGIAALAFSAHHLVVTLQFFPAPLAFFLAACVAIGGVIWTQVYQHQGTLVGCWLSHLCVDAFLMTVGYQLINAS